MRLRQLVDLDKIGGFRIGGINENLIAVAFLPTIDISSNVMWPRGRTVFDLFHKLEFSKRR